ncbi:OmpA family protein [Daejeonella lutea]|uniref:WD40-like Beta Propeller Repeat n=1 Tax=Daejeonella lutea TaxID=572036 RepID=A0A1T5EEB2_9SPHI|nr:OmpA family protein [Daejeonella lutea]SKB82281.1 WD40-like Beta Propeller Repeat [Daejeonella lutea]
MNRLIALLLVLVLHLGGGSCFAFFQEDDGPLMQKAIREYNALRFVSAIKELTKVIKKDPLNIKAQELLASSYRNTKVYDEALHWYAELTNQKHIKPEWALYYAEALANKERYEESEKWYRKYLALQPTDRRAAAFSKANLGALSKDEGNWDIEFLNINSDASEYSPMFYKDGLIFISNRNEKSRYMFAWDQTPYTDMFIVDDLEDIRESDESSIERRLSGKSDKPNSLVSLLFGHGKADSAGASEIARLLQGKVRSSYHEGPAVRLPEGSLMFTRNNYNNKKAGSSSAGINKLKLYTALGDNWDEIVEFPYNNDEYSTGHPAITPDGRVLIFASDSPRGYGGTDLYYCVRTSERGNWGRPVNLGPKINTEGNEQFPYVDKNGKLYFSSTGYPGLGGLDIFEVMLKDMKPVGKPQNLGAGINSPADDFGLIKEDGTDNGYFSSNRRGNDDIYKFKKLAFAVKVQGLVLDSRTNTPIAGSKVLVKHNGIIDTLQTNPFGEFTMPLGKSDDYELSGRALAYVSKEEFISTRGIDKDSTIRMVLRLNKAENVQKWVLTNCDSLKTAFAFENVHYELDNAELRSEDFDKLNRVADVMKKNPQISVITSSHTDSRASDSYNKDLSLRRGQSVRSYLVSRGISADRIEVKYYGKSRLVNSCEDEMNCSEADQALNRRTEFEVIINNVNLAQLDCKK